MPTRPKSLLYLLPLCAASFGITVSFAQTLPPASRTVYKCQEANKVYYSDSPCLGAQKLDIQPTRGMDTSSGREIIGKDIRHEQHREAMAHALHPLTGMDTKQLNRAGRRTRLTPEAQRECQRLDQELPQAERVERLAKGEDLKSSQLRLLSLRSTFRTQGCE